MKKINLLILSLVLISCGREADEPQVQQFTFNQMEVVSFSADKEVSSEVRSATIVVVPERQDVKDLEFRPLEGETADEWNDLFNSLDYAEFLPKEFSKETALDKKILGVQEVVMASGALRDDFLRSISAQEKLLESKSEALREFENTSGMNDVTCFYKDRPRRGKPYVCRFEESIAEGFKRTKSFYSCEKWPLFTLDSGQETMGQFSIHQNISNSCLSLQKQVDEVNEKIQNFKAVRKSAENVVLDLLLETEKTTSLVFAAKASTIEKPDSIGPESSLVFSEDLNSVEEFKLYIDFLPGNASKVGYYEYSMENGSITNVELYVSELGVKKLKFNLKLPDMEFVVNADVSMSPMPMGMRVVDSEAEVTFKSGEKRNGVFKLEFDFL